MGNNSCCGRSEERKKDIARVNEYAKKKNPFMAQQVMKYFDQDGDKKVSFEEFLAVVLQRNVMEEKKLHKFAAAAHSAIRTLFNVHGKSFSDRYDEAEDLSAFLKQFHPILRPLFDVLDIDGSGYVDPYELNLVLTLASGGPEVTKETNKLYMSMFFLLFGTFSGARYKNDDQGVEPAEVAARVSNILKKYAQFLKELTKYTNGVKNDKGLLFPTNIGEMFFANCPFVSFDMLQNVPEFLKAMQPMLEMALAGKDKDKKASAICTKHLTDNLNFKSTVDAVDSFKKIAKVATFDRSVLEFLSKLDKDKNDEANKIIEAYNAVFEALLSDLSNDAFLTMPTELAKVLLEYFTKKELHPAYVNLGMPADKEIPIPITRKFMLDNTKFDEKDEEKNAEGSSSSSAATKTVEKESSSSSSSDSIKKDPTA
eukprot:g1805.t1